jgi:sugar lactone lactonase YvrE
MKSEKFTVVHDEPMQVGECPVWHAVESALYWVDINGFTVHRLHPASGKYSSWKMATEPSALAVDQDNNLVVATRAGFVYLNTSSGEVDRHLPRRPTTPGSCASTTAASIRRAASGSAPCTNRATSRRPRCTCSSSGKLRQAWSGGMTNSNGLAWSPDGRTMYHADTTSHRIDAYDYDVATGTASNQRNLVAFSTDKKAPGLRRPSGRRGDRQRRQLLGRDVRGRPHRQAVADQRTAGEIQLPVRCPTAVCFGGPDLRTCM